MWTTSRPLDQHTYRKPMRCIWSALHTRTRHKAEMVCSQHSVISTGLPLSVDIMSLATVSRSAFCFLLFFFSFLEINMDCALERTDRVSVYRSASGCGWWESWQAASVARYLSLWFLKQQWLRRWWWSRKAKVIEDASWWQRWALGGWLWVGLSVMSWRGWWAELYSLEAAQPEATSTTLDHWGSPENTGTNKYNHYYIIQKVETSLKVTTSVQWG